MSDTTATSSNNKSETGVAPWRSPLSRALHRNRALAYARYLQLATVGADGRPHNRTVVFRGFVDDLGESNLLKFISDQRSQKVAQLSSNAWAEACWYFPKTREQFRLSGKIISVGDRAQPPYNESSLSSRYTTQRQATWQALSDKARSQFYWPQPGELRQEEEQFLSSSINPPSPPHTFTLLLLSPNEVDHLELRGNPQNRFLYRKDSNQTWKCFPINP